MAFILKKMSFAIVHSIVSFRLANGGGVIYGFEGIEFASNGPSVTPWGLPRIVGMTLPKYYARIGMQPE